MKKTIRKIFLAWEFEKEEKWLNEMAATGLQLCGVGFCKYTFEEGFPGEYVYRMELLDHLPAHAESVQYIAFMKDAEIEHIGSLHRWVYFRRKSGENSFGLFSDIDSRIKHLSKIFFSIVFLSGLNLFHGINNINLWFSTHMNANLIVGILCLLAALLLGYGCLRLLLKKRKLGKEKIWRE